MPGSKMPDSSNAGSGCCRVLEAHQMRDCLLRGHLREALDFLGRATEAGSLQQMCGAIVASSPLR
jgi:hypothetical protein